MTSRQQRRLSTEAEALLEPGERVVFALVAQASGASQSRTTRGAVGGVAGMVVGDAMHKKTEESHTAAGEAGLRLHSPMGFILTDRRVLTVRIDALSHGAIKELLSEIPLSTVDKIERKKSFGILGAKFVVTVRGTDVDIECTSKSEVNELIAAFDATKGAPT